MPERLRLSRYELKQILTTKMREREKNLSKTSLLSRGLFYNKNIRYLMAFFFVLPEREIQRNLYPAGQSKTYFDVPNVFQSKYLNLERSTKKN